jgi:general secretion pathway protein L
MSGARYPLGTILKQRVLGLDIGAHSVKAAEVVHTPFRGLEIGQLRTLEIAPGADLAAELREFLRVYELPTDAVVCALPGDRVSSRRLSFPFSDVKRIAQAVPFEVEGQVPFDLEGFLLDWEPVRRHRGATDVMATLARRSEVGTLLEALREAGIEPRVVEAEGLVLANLGVLFELSGTRLLVDVGHRKTTLCLLCEGRPVAARTIPLAGQALTEAVAQERGLSEPEAERLKQEAGVFPPDVEPGEGKDQPILDRLARELLRTVGSLEPVLRETTEGGIEEVTLLGGSARLHRLAEYLKQRTGLPVAMLEAPAEPHRTALLAAGDPMLFAPALALAVRGTPLARTRMNFRQDEFARRVDLTQYGSQFRQVGWRAAAAILVALVWVLLGITMGNRQARDLETQTAALYEQAFPDRPLPDNVPAAMRTAVQDAHGRADLLGVYAGNLSALDILAELSARIPENLPVIFEELNIDRQTIRIRGHTERFENVDRLRAELEGFAPFSQIRVSEIQSDARRGGKTFNLTISLGERGDAQ